MEYKINYLSDFGARVRLWVEEEGKRKEMGFPKCAFSVSLAVGNPDLVAKKWSAAWPYEGDDASPIVESRGRIKLFADSHGLGKGPMYISIDADIEDLCYADGYRRLHFVQKAGIELVGVGGGDRDDVEIPLVLPPAWGAVSDIVLGEEDTEPEGSVAEALASLGKAYADGLEAIRSAVERKGIETSVADTFATLAAKIDAIEGPAS